MAKNFFGKLTILVILAGIMAASMGCASTATPITGRNPFLGTWESVGHPIPVKIIFNSDGTGSQSWAKFTYTVEGNTAKVTAGFVIKATQTIVITGDSLIFQGVTFKHKG